MFSCIEVHNLPSFKNVQYMIRWLHLSDLHLGNEDMSSSEMRARLLDFIKKDVGTIDYIFLTGDILTAGPRSSGYTPEMAEFLQSICSACGVDSDRLFIVAGNHDVNRDAPQRDEAIRRVKFQWNGYYDPMNGEIQEEDRKLIWNGQNDFRAFLSSIYTQPHLQFYLQPEAPHFSIETEHFNILHLDSTLSYTKDQEASNLIIGTKYLQNVLKGINSKKPTILLSHYPITSLLQDEKKEVGILLQHYGVRLWLAGHEHDHCLMPYQYLHHLQAGELRYERGATSSILIGSYDPISHGCQVKAYKWYNEGWATYPFVNLDSDEKDVYKFELKPYENNPLPALTKKTRLVNEPAMYRLTDKLNKSLFPRIESQFDKSDIQSLLDCAWQSGTNGLILIGEGGMGKSTMLLSFCNESTKPALYVSAEQMASLGFGIEEYCIDSIFDGDEKSYRAATSIRFKDQSLIIIIDGLNEVDADSEGRLIRDIQRMNFLKGIQIVIASRVDFTFRYNLNGYCKASVEGPGEDALQRFFTANEWATICKSPNLRRLLQNPMLATIYKEVCSIIEDFQNVEFLTWRLPISTSTDLFFNYYLAQIALMMKRQGISGRKVLEAIYCIDVVLPAIAYRYEESYSINKLNEDFRSILSGMNLSFFIDEDELEAARDYFSMRKPIKMTSGTISDTLINELHLMHREGNTTSFSHQMYRDYLAAKFILNESTSQEKIGGMWNRRLFAHPLARHICNGSGKYWCGTALDVKNCASTLATPAMIIKNIFNCFPSSAEGGVADFSNLDLEDTPLPDAPALPAKISLKGSSINFASLGLDIGSPEVYRLLAFSEDQKFLAAATVNRIEIFDIRNNQSVFTFRIGLRAVNMIFYHNYLLVNAGSVMVFGLDEKWRFIGEISPRTGRISNRQTKFIIAQDSSLYIGYKNCLMEYNLENCLLIRSIPGSHDQINFSGSTSLNQLKCNLCNIKDPGLSNQEIAVATLDKLCAKSYIDGRIEIYLDKEPFITFGRKVTVLQDAAISDAGNLIVTLSSDIFADGRRLQIWDADKNLKLEERFCDSAIEKINLSANGKWILGVAQKGTWIFNRATGCEEWSKETFVSNQHGKLITIGDTILRKDRSTGRLESRDLKTGKVAQMQCTVENPSIVCLLNNQEIAAVDNHSSALYFPSDRTGRQLRIYNSGETIQAVQAFKSQPFIAVAASSGMVSIYHTGTGQRTRKLDNNYCHVHITACHPTKTILAHTDGRRRLSLEFYYETNRYGKKIGWWRSYSYQNNLDSRILDLAFNASQSSLIVILANGRILYLTEDKCEYLSSSRIITSFNTDAYDFTDVRCSKQVAEVLTQNKCLQ